MKKLFLFLICLSGAVMAAFAGDGDSRLTIAGGFQFPETLDAQLGYEYDLSSGSAVEIYGELGNHWQHPTCHMFWKGYYWDGGINYKFRIHRYKNSLLRVRGGIDAGADRRKFFFGVEAGLEWEYVFSSGIRFYIMEKNNVNFLHGDTFRNGLLIGFKFPL